VKKLLTLLLIKKTRPKGRATKVEPDWGCRFQWPVMGRERAYAGLQRIHKKALLSLIVILILIKDYSGDMSKNWREKLEKPGKNRQTVNKIYTDIY
jgi:hypothetical protein